MANILVIDDSKLMRSMWREFVPGAHQNPLKTIGGYSLLLSVNSGYSFECPSGHQSSPIQQFQLFQKMFQFGQSLVKDFVSAGLDSDDLQLSECGLQ